MAWLEKSWHFHVRFGVGLALTVVMGIFAWAVLMRFEVDSQLNNRLRGYETDIRRGDFVVKRRLAELTRSEDEARSLIMARVKEIAADQEIIRQAALKAPFNVEALLPTMAEIVCVDGRQPPNYYTGSGTVIERDGLILTNNHVLMSEAGRLINFCGVGLSDDLSRPPKISFMARVVASNVDEDLALLKISGRLDGAAVKEEFAALDISQASTLAGSLKVGDPVYIGGYPTVGADTLTITEGVVAGRVGANVIKTSAYVDSGASGGAVFDTRGRFVGVPAAAARGEIGGSLGYLISGSAVQLFMDEYRAGQNLVKLETLKNK
jgi:S1-C subfamily serine protease